MNIFDTTILLGKKVQLEPLKLTHEQELYKAAQDEAIWTYHLSNGLGENFYKWFAKGLKYAELNLYVPYVVRRLTDNTIVGCTRYYDINEEHKRSALYAAPGTSAAPPSDRARRRCRRHRRRRYCARRRRGPARRRRGTSAPPR